MKNLTILKDGQSGTVATITSQGAMRKRLLDLGVVKGAVIERLFSSPSANPVAYLIKGAVIALRNDDAKDIILE